MKHIDTWLRENDYQRFKRMARRMGATDYAAAQALILQGLQLQRARESWKLLSFWFIIYSLVVTVAVLVF